MPYYPGGKTSSTDASSAPVTKADLAAVFKAGKKAGAQKVKSKYRQRKEADKGHSGLFGTGLGPDYGLDDLVNEPVTIAKDFAGMGAALGNTASDYAWYARHKTGFLAEQNDQLASAALKSANSRSRQLGLGMAGSIAGTASDVADLGALQPIRGGIANATGLDLVGYGPGKLIRKAGAAVLPGKDFDPRTFGQRMQRGEHSSVLSPLLEDVGNVAMVAGAATLGAKAVGATGAAEAIHPWTTPLKEAWTKTGRRITSPARALVEGEEVAPHPLAEGYNKANGLGKVRRYPEVSNLVDEATNKRIADEWQGAPGDLTDPRVAKGQADFSSDIMRIKKYLEDQGYTYDVVDPADNPYYVNGETDPALVKKDLTENKHLYVDKTGGFGEDVGYLDPEVNDAFRAVHDTLHNTYDFAQPGEEAAFKTLDQMLSTPESKAFHAGEIRGQTAMLRETGAFPPQKPVMLDEMGAPDATLSKGNTPRMERAIKNMSRPTPPAVGKLLERLGPDHPVTRALARIDQISVNNDLRTINTEYRRMFERARNEERMNPAVQESVQAATDMIRKRIGVGPRKADLIVGQMLEWRISEKEGFFAQDLAANPELAQIMQEEGIMTVGIPDEVLNDPQIMAQVDQAAELWKARADERIAGLRANRPGDAGLETVGSGGPRLNRRQQQLLKRAMADAKRIETLKGRQAIERQRLTEKIAQKGEANTRYLDAIQKRVAAGEALRTAFDMTLDGVPEVFGKPAQLAQGLTDLFAATVGENGGGTWMPHDNALYPGTDGYATSVNVGTLAQVPRDQFNVGVLQQIAMDYQDVFTNPDYGIGTWVDDNGMVNVDVSQTTMGGTPLTRDEAIILGRARAQESIWDFKRGEAIYMDDTPGGTNEALLLAEDPKAMAARNRKVAPLRKVLDEGGHFTTLTHADLDAFVALWDRAAMNDYNSGRVSSLEEWWKRAPAMKPGKNPRGLPTEALLQEVMKGVHMDDPKAIIRMLSETKDLQAQAEWYYGTHDWVESTFRTNPKTGEEWMVSLPSGAQRPMADLMYDLLAVTSFNASPTANLGFATSFLEDLAHAEKGFAATKKMAARLAEGGLTEQELYRLAQAADKELFPGQGSGRPGLPMVREGIMSLFMDLNPDGTARGISDWGDINYWNERIARREELGRQEFVHGGRKNPPTPHKPLEDMGSPQANVDEYTSSINGKIQSFRDNMARPDESMMATADSWMAYLWGEEPSTVWKQAGSMGRFRQEVTRATEIFNEAYPEHAVRPHVMQALFWTWAKQELTRLEKRAFIGATDATIAMIREGKFSPEHDPTPPVLWQNHLDAVEANKAAPPKERNVMQEDKVLRSKRDTLEGKATKPKQETRRYIASADKEVLSVLNKRREGYAAVSAKVAELVAKGDIDAAVEVFTSWRDKEWNARQAGWAGSADANDFAQMRHREDIAGGRFLKQAGLADVPIKKAPRPLAGLDETLAREGGPRVEAINDAARSKYGVATPENVAEVLNDPNPPAPDVLAQQFRRGLEGSVKGAFIDKAANPEIRLFQDADFTTLVHEGAHAMRRIMPDEMIAVAEKRYNVKNGTWTRAQEEGFANDFVRYLNTREAPAGLEGVFRRTHAALADLWAHVMHKFAKAIPDDLAQQWDKWLTDESFQVLERDDITPGTGGLDLELRRPGDVRSMRQRLRETPAITKSRDTGPQGYRRGSTAGRIMANSEANDRAIAQLTAHQARVQKELTALKADLANDQLPSVIAAQKLEQRRTATLGRLMKAMDGAPASSWPAEWQPIGFAIEELMKRAETDATLAPMLEEIPKTFREVVARAKELGLDPKHIRDFTPGQIDQLVYDPVKLGGRLGKEFKAGTRNPRTGRLVKSGGVERSIEALAAAHLEVVHERMSNQFADYIERYVAQPKPTDGNLPKGYVPWDAVKKVMMVERIDPETGARIEVPSPNTDLMIPEATARTLKRMQQDYSHSIFKGLSKVTSPWRAFVLTMSPRWYVNNMFGNAILATLEGVRIQDWVKAWKEYKNHYAETPAVTRHSYVSDLNENTYIPNSKGVEGFRDAAARGDTNVQAGREVVRHTASRLRRANEAVDELARAAVYHRALRKGFSPEVALNRAYEAMVDYGNLSPFERQVVRSIVPFYAWQKGILRIMARMPIDHPIVMGLGIQFGELNRQLMEDRWGGQVPSAYLGMVDAPFGSPFDKSKTPGQISTRGMNPFVDSTALITADGIASSLNPFVSVLARKALGAPELGYADDYRMDPYGFSIPDTNLGSEYTDIVKGLPVTQAGGKVLGSGPYGEGQTALKLLGVNYNTATDLKKARERAQKYRVAVGLERTKTAKKERAKRLKAGIPSVLGSSSSSGGGYLPGGSR